MYLDPNANKGFELLIDMGEDAPTEEDESTQRRAVGPELRSVLDQLNKDNQLRNFGWRFFVQTLGIIKRHEVGTVLTEDQWWTLRHGVIDRLITARVHCRSDDMLVLRKESVPGLQNTQRGTIFPAAEAMELIKKILGPSTPEQTCSVVIAENFFQPQDFIGEFNLKDFR
jgi:hypothetical protein